MKQSEIFANAKETIISKFKTIIDESNGEQFGDYDYAMPVEIDGKEVWVSVSLTAHKYETTGKIKAFDVFAKQAEWREIITDRTKREKENAKKKAKKIAKAKAEQGAEKCDECTI